MNSALRFASIRVPLLRVASECTMVADVQVCEAPFAFFHLDICSVATDAIALGRRETGKSL